MIKHGLLTSMKLSLGSIQCFLGGGLIEIGGLVNIFAQKGGLLERGCSIKRGK